jgi:hypothetical protein
LIWWFHLRTNWSWIEKKTGESCSHVAETITYIQNQVEHHRFKSFQEEYVAFLKKHGIRFEETISLGLITRPAFERPSGTRSNFKLEYRR